MASSSDLVHLHVHSEYSILDGCGKQGDFIEYAKHLGHPAACFTEHGSLRGAYKLHENSTSIGGIKPIYGIEFYMAQDHRMRGLSVLELDTIRSQHTSKVAQNKAVKEREEQLGIKRRFHATVLAKTNQGLKNLYKLSTIGWTDGFYFRPRIDLDLLEHYGDGLIVLSGCLDGYISNAILAGRFDLAMDLVERFRNRWGDDFYLEVMPNSLPQQIKINAAIGRISRATGVPLVGTADVHYILKDDWEVHEVLLCVNTKKRMSDPNRWTFGTREFWFQTREEIERMFRANHPSLTRKQIRKALDETVRIAEKCDTAMDIDRFRVLTPHLKIPAEYGGSDFRWLLSLCDEGWDRRDIPRRAEALAAKQGQSLDTVLEKYAERLRHELTIIKDKKADRYFLIIWDMYEWVRSQEIVYGPGRGSVGGSLVAFLIGITAVDPVEHGLVFERFLNPARIDMPDIDCDFEDRRRAEIVDWLRARYGENKVTGISTVIRMTGKSCLRDLARALDVPPGEVDAVSKSIAPRSSSDERESQTIEDAMTEFEVGRNFNAKYPDVLRFAKRLEGQARGLGLHAAGVAVSSGEMTEWVPLETRSHDGRRVTCTAYGMRGAEAQGLMKIDVLGLRTLSVVSDALAAIKERTGEAIDLNWIDFNDPKVLKNFTDGNFAGIFQFDTTSAKKICKGVTFDRFDDIPAMIALDRPGTVSSGLAAEYLKRKMDPSKRVSIHPVIDAICEDTLGVIVYQEHVIKIFIEIAGFTPSEADLLRKKIGKKLGLEKDHESFVKGAVSKGFKEGFAEDLFEKIKFFGDYGFNKCLAPDTYVIRAGANKEQLPKITISELYAAQESKTPWGSKIRSGRLNILQMDPDGRIRPGRLKKIHKNGKAQVVEITTETGKKIRATSNHRFLTDSGYYPVRHILPGDNIVCIAPMERNKCPGHQNERARKKKYKGCSGGLGVPIGKENPAWIDGRHTALVSARIEVTARARGVCENCGSADIGAKTSGPRQRKTNLEFAHQRSLEECDGDFDLYHSTDNIRHLCNSCHKLLDYNKGERKKRWAKGRPTSLECVIEIEVIPGKVDVFDIEMDTSEHNFIANGLVSHNSHATAYGVISYWEMWLKTYYPLEFMWGLLTNEPDRVRIMRLVREARRLGIEVLQPDINESGRAFTISGDAIRAGLVDLKGVGNAAVASITASQPFTDFADLVARVNLRAVHKGVILALAKAGALIGLVPNARWFVENLETFWKRRETLNWSTVLAASINEPDYTDDERTLTAAEVSPLTFGRHPIEPYDDFLDRFGVDWGSTEGDSIWDRKWAWIRGIVSGVRYNQVGHFHAGKELDDNEKKRMNWGARFANVNIEDASGESKRVKVGHDIFDQVRPIVDSGVGTPVVALVTVSKRWKSLRTKILLDVAALRRKADAGGKWTAFEGALVEPARFFAGYESEDLTRKIRRARKQGRRLTGVALIVLVTPKLDKNMNEMGFVTIYGYGGAYETVAFASVWPQVRRAMRSGKLIRMTITVEKSNSYFIESAKIIQ